MMFRAKQTTEPSSGYLEETCITSETQVTSSEQNKTTSHGPRKPIKEFIIIVLLLCDALLLCNNCTKEGGTLSKKESPISI